MKSADQNKPKKNRGMVDKEEITVYNEKDGTSSVTYKYRNDVFSIFEHDLFAELYNARCHDTGEPVSIESARQFKEILNKANATKIDHLDFHGMRLGINSIISLANSLLYEKLVVLNVADNSLSDYGMHAIKNILETTHIEHLNLASNMVSGDGLETLTEAICNHKYLKSLDLGLQEGSMRKNSLGLHGASCIAAIVIKNQSINTLILNDNDIGKDGGDCIGIALSQNMSLKYLTLAENELRTDGAISILENAVNLETLDLSKNYIAHEAGQYVEHLLKKSSTIREIKIEYNELLIQGVESIARGIKDTQSLQILNLQGNILGDDGIMFLVASLYGNNTLQKFNIALNEIGPLGASSVAQVLPHTAIKHLNISKNFLGDEALKIFADILITGPINQCKLKYLNLSSCRLNDKGVRYFFRAMQSNSFLQRLRMADNFISEKLEKPILECFTNNYTIENLILSGNRIGHACMKKIRSLCTRNKREQENAEPTRLKNEAYRLQYERQKLLAAQENLNQNIFEVDRARALRDDINMEMKTVREYHKAKRNEEKEKVEEEKVKIDQKNDQAKNIQDEIVEIEDKYSKEMEVLQADLDERLELKAQLLAEIQQLHDENRDLDEDYPKQISELEQKTEETRKQAQEYQDKATLAGEELRNLKALLAEKEETNPTPDQIATAGQEMVRQGSRKSTLKKSASKK